MTQVRKLGKNIRIKSKKSCKNKIVLEIEKMKCNIVYYISLFAFLNIDLFKGNWICVGRLIEQM